jgi:hypothetical protein
MKRSVLITLSTIVLSVIVTTLAIDAADTFSGSSGSLLSQVLAPRVHGCPEGMVVTAGVTFTCVDQYEVSPSAECPYADTTNLFDSRANIESSQCEGVSVTRGQPWVNIAREQAAALCARRGARLPTNSEWYQVALAMRDTPHAIPIQIQWPQRDLSNRVQRRSECMTSLAMCGSGRETMR